MKNFINCTFDMIMSETHSRYVEEVRASFKIFVEKPKRRGYVGDLGSIKMHLKEIVYGPEILVLYL
jgi:hypothetical protein